MKVDQAKVQPPTVSVIIPTYNRSALLTKAVESVLAQTIKPLEIIIIDDGSTDDTKDVINTFQGTQVKAHHHNQSKGPSACRNVGIDLAQGSFVAFLDDDDSWLPEKLEKQIAWIDQMAMTTDDFLCFTHIVLHYPDHEDPSRLIPFSDSDTVGEYLYIKGGALLTSSLILSKSLSFRLRFDESLRNHEDWLYFLQAESLGVKITTVPKYLVKIRRSENHAGLSSTLTSGMAKEWINRIDGLVTERAKHGYAGSVLAKRLIIEGRRGEGLKVAAVAWMKKGIRLRRFISLLLRAVSPRLRTMIKKIGSMGSP